MTVLIFPFLPSSSLLAKMAPLFASPSPVPPLFTFTSPTLTGLSFDLNLNLDGDASLTLSSPSPSPSPSLSSSTSTFSFSSTSPSTTSQHTFASFLSRDTTYDLIGNIWRMVHPVVPMSAGLPDAYDNRSNAGHSHIESDEEGDGNAEETGGGGASSTGVEQPQKAKRRLRGFRRPRGGTGESTKPASGSADASATNGGAGGNGANGSGGADGKSGDDRSREASGSGSATAAEKPHAPTSDTCDVLRGLKETCLDSVFPGRPEKIYNLMFTSGFMKDFWAENQKLLGAFAFPAFSSFSSFSFSPWSKAD